jgi:hypothetical protein
LAQVHILSNEVLLEKRFGIAQLVLLLSLFVFMALTRGSRAAVPLLHQGIARISRNTSTPLQDSVRSVPSSTGTVRAIPNQGNDNRVHVSTHETPKVRQRHPLPSTPLRVERRIRDRLLIGAVERPVRLRGLIRKRPSITVLSSPAVSADKGVGLSKRSQRHDSASSHASVVQYGEDSVRLSLPSSTPRPTIRLDTHNISPSPAKRSMTPSRFDREDTPTNFRQFQFMTPQQVPISKRSSSSPPNEEAISSDWGTERSEDEDSTSHTTFADMIQERQEKEMPITLSLDNSNTTTSVDTEVPPAIPLVTPSFAAIRRIEESDAEEDSMQWSPVKSRRSLKRPGSSGNQHSNNLSRVHTPTNASTTPFASFATPPRRTFSPFHKNNAELKLDY